MFSVLLDVGIWCYLIRIASSKINSYFNLTYKASYYKGIILYCNDHVQIATLLQYNRSLKIHHATITPVEETLGVVHRQPGAIASPD